MGLGDARENLHQAVGLTENSFQIFEKLLRVNNLVYSLFSRKSLSAVTAGSIAASITDLPGLAVRSPKNVLKHIRRLIMAVGQYAWVTWNPDRSFTRSDHRISIHHASSLRLTSLRKRPRSRGGSYLCADERLDDPSDRISDKNP